MLRVCAKHILSRRLVGTACRSFSSNRFVVGIVKRSIIAAAVPRRSFADCAAAVTTRSKIPESKKMSYRRMEYDSSKKVSEQMSGYSSGDELWGILVNNVEYCVRYIGFVGRFDTCEVFAMTPDFPKFAINFKSINGSNVWGYAVELESVDMFFNKIMKKGNIRIPNY
ncbi:MAG: hypothetical protein Hyperionvirus6_45 [Hyperionvirus sp.]|uniref:Uncharacterized protein n=1 Tax=Hyperionvirus sp. TaxID=2487770 RepID=A0A3G5AA39_9VIRU|nr:MAG: hypothetical protein Hyperionvirus6_45 [Hyperionvirus sp.]